MSTIVIMPGGFHPFHAGHAALYQSAVKAFPGAEVFVAATNDTSNRPFPFAIKEKLARLAGVAPGHFVQVKSPFRAEEITAKFDPAKDRLIFVRSEKDADKPPQAGGVKKNGEPAYLQLLAGQTTIAPFSKHAYMAYLPTVEFGPGMTSATEIRTAWTTLNDRRKTALVMSLYPQTQQNPALAANVVKMLDTAIGGDSVEEDISRRGFLRGLGAAALAGAAGSAVAQTMPNINAQQVELANKYYNALVQRAKEDGRELDRRALNFLRAKAQEAAAQKFQQTAPSQSKPQQGFPTQGSERKVAKDAAQFESQGVAEDAVRSEAQASYMQGECMILAVAINQYNPKRYPIGYIWEYNMSAGAPDMQMDDDEWTDLSPEEQQEISNDISRHSVVHAYVRDQETNEYIDARGRHKTLPNLWGRMGQTRFDEFPGTARELIDITAHGDWDEVGDQVNFKRGQPAFDSLAGPAGVKRALDYAVKYLGVVGPEQVQKPVTQGVELVDLDTDVNQNIYTLTVDGDEVSFTYWDYENNFENPNINDIYQQAKEQLGKKLSPENVKEIARAVFKSFQQGMSENQGWAATFTNEDDYIEEKWSSKYKSSINCAAPKGFSQRAHCAGRKK
jgi:nicotinamide mononucleotide adenylyltransferase